MRSVGRVAFRMNLSRYYGHDSRYLLPGYIKVKREATATASTHYLDSIPIPRKPCEVRNLIPETTGRTGRDGRDDETEGPDERTDRRTGRDRLDVAGRTGRDGRK